MGSQINFRITSGRERWLYRVARKHAGRQSDGFALGFETLFQKSGAEGSFRRFKFELLRIAKADPLPDYALTIEGECLRMRLREAASDIEEPLERQPRFRLLSGYELEGLRVEFPRLDLYACQAEFDAWLDRDEQREPRDYFRALRAWLARRHAGLAA